MLRHGAGEAVSPAVQLPARAERPILFKAEMVRQILAGKKVQTRRILDLSRAVGKPVAGPGEVLGLWYPGSTAHYGTTLPESQRPAWQVQRLCSEACEPSPKDVYPPTGHVDWKGPIDGWPGPYDGRHPVAWGLLPFWPGMRLWVKETWWPRTGDKRRSEVLYRATDEAKMLPNSVAWKSSLFMPRWASRITLEVTEVRIERLQAITEKDARAEGVSEGTIPADDHGPTRAGYVLGPDDGNCILYPTAREAFANGWDGINGEKAPWKSDPFVMAVSFARVEA